MQPLAKKHVYFPNLDGLRFLGSLSIIIFHIEGIKSRHGQQIIPWIKYFNPDGSHSVSLFFVLSGFLITYLLLREKKDTGDINMKKFYARRILKIWPLYFFIGIIGFFVMPHLDFYFYGDYSNCVDTHFWRDLILYFCFLPPLMPSEAIGAAWSVRVEEAFYLVWPWLLKWFKNYYKAFWFVVIGVLLLRNTGVYLVHHYHKHMFVAFVHLIRDYRVSCMAFGGLAAYLYVEEKTEILNILYKKNLQRAVYALLFVLLCFKVIIPRIHFEAYALLFAYAVLNLATNPQSVIRLDYKWMNYLGKISYGLYLYNPIVRIFCLEGIEHLYKSSVMGWQMNLLLYISVIGGTILVAILSYELFEKRFLKLKKYFAS